MSNRTLNIYLKVLFKPIFFFISLILWYSNLYAQVNWTKVSSVSDFYLEFLKLQNGKLLCAAGNPNTGSVVNAIYETSNLRSWTANSATFSSAIHLFFGQTEVKIPFKVNRESNKRFKMLKVEMTENTTGYEVYLRDIKKAELHDFQRNKIYPIEFDVFDSEINRYELVFMKNNLLSQDFSKQISYKSNQYFQLYAYPNPVDNNLHLEVLHNDIEIDFNIYSLSGAILMNGRIKKVKTINTEGLEPGIYIVEVGGHNFKFLKN